MSSGRPMTTSWPAFRSGSSSSGGPLGPVAMTVNLTGGPDMAPDSRCRLLADHVQQRRPLVLPHHAQGLAQHLGQDARVLDALGPVAARPRDALVVRRRV